MCRVVRGTGAKMVQFATFERVAEVAEASIAAIEQLPGFPRDMANLWRHYGTGFIGQDGYVRLIDPAHYLQFLPDWFSDTDGAVPFAATGMGDLFIWQAGVVRHVLYRVGHIQNLPVDIPAMSADFEAPGPLDGWLRRGQYGEGLAAHGRPALYEAFFYAPFLVMGGPEAVSNLQRGDLAVSLAVFSRIAGRASLIPGKPASGS